MAGNENTGPQSRRRQPIHRQFVGLVAGLLVGFLLQWLYPQILARINFSTLMLVSALLGSSLASLDQFERAGAALTKGENRALNYTVGLGIPIVLFVIFMLVL